MPIEDIRDNPDMIAREDLGSFKGNISPEWDRLHGHGTEDDIKQQDPDKENDVEVFTVYEAKEHTWFQMTMDGLSKPLREPEDWPRLRCANLPGRTGFFSWDNLFRVLDRMLKFHQRHQIRPIRRRAVRRSVCLREQFPGGFEDLFRGNPFHAFRMAAILVTGGAVNIA